MQRSKTNEPETHVVFSRQTFSDAGSTPAASTNFLMTIRAIVHKAAEGGFWAEVPSIPGCATQGETMEELRFNLREAIEGCLSVPVEPASMHIDDQVIELAL
jgi:predicted RNase H-like HicB family nuclease